MFQPFVVQTVIVVGLDNSGNGRSCNLHSCCGSVVVEGMVLTVRRAYVSINGVKQWAYKVYALDAAKDDLHPEEEDLGCHVGFLPKARLDEKEDYDSITLLVKGPFSRENFKSVPCFKLAL